VYHLFIEKHRKQIYPLGKAFYNRYNHLLKAKRRRSPRGMKVVVQDAEFIDILSFTFHSHPSPITFNN